MLIAPYNVLLRLYVSRHPPYALILLRITKTLNGACCYTDMSIIVAYFVIIVGILLFFSLLHVCSPSLVAGVTGNIKYLHTLFDFSCYILMNCQSTDQINRYCHVDPSKKSF